MPRSIRPLVLSVALGAAGALFFACTPGAGDPPGGGGSGGTAGAPPATGGQGGAGFGGTPGSGGGTAGTGGAAGNTGGTGGGTAGTGGRGGGGSGGGTAGTGGAAGNAGAGGSGGAAGVGGTAGGGSGGNAGAGGGAAGRDGGAGAGGAGGAGGAAQPGGPAKPSAGCGKANPPRGARTITTGGRTANFIVVLPAGYDPNKPMPLGFAYHGYSLNEKTCAAGPECPGFKDMKAITVYQKSIGPGWESPIANLAPNIKFFEDTLALMKAEYCVDENRVFVAGVSSGGQFVEHLSCKLGDQLWAVSPIAAYVDRGVDMGCTTTTPAQIVIHGITDNLVRNGHAVRDLYARRNGCPTVPAAMMETETRIKAAFDARRVEFACLDYAGCANAPLRYCVFSQITYNGLTHGWPNAGGMLIEQFLGTLK